MISFLKNFILDIFYGKRLKISVERVEKYKEVETAFKTLLSCPSMPAVVVTGDSFDKISKDIPYKYHLTQLNCECIRNLVIPAVAYQFFLSGGTWEEIDEYNAVKKYGMLHNKKRRL